jgi:hypothetical protein
MEEMPARRIVDAYADQVKSAYGATDSTTRNVSWWLAHGQTEAGLMLAVKNYAADMDHHKKAARYRKSPANFFARADPGFTPYVRPAPAPQKPAPQKPAPTPEKPATGQQMREFLDRARRRIAAAG